MKFSYITNFLDKKITHFLIGNALNLQLFPYFCQIDLCGIFVDQL